MNDADKVYVVIGESGSYSAYRMWLVKAFDNKEAATKYARDCDAEVKRMVQLTKDNAEPMSAVSTEVREEKYAKSKLSKEQWQLYSREMSKRWAKILNPTLDPHWNNGLCLWDGFSEYEDPLYTVVELAMGDAAKVFPMHRAFSTTEEVVHSCDDEQCPYCGPGVYKANKEGL